MPRHLHPDYVILARRYHANGYSITAIAAALEVSRSTVSDVVHFKTHTRVYDTGKPLRRLKTNSLPIRPDGLTDEQARSIQAERSRAAHEVHRHVREKQQAEAAEKAKAEAEAQAAARVQAEEAEAASRRWIHFVVSGSKARAGKVKAHCGALVDVQDRGDSYAVGPYEFREFEELGLYMCGRCQPEADRRFTVVFG